MPGHCRKYRNEPPPLWECSGALRFRKNSKTRSKRPGVCNKRPGALFFCFCEVLQEMAHGAGRNSVG